MPIPGHLDEDQVSLARIVELGLQSCPQNDAVGRGVAGRDALGIELAALGPRCSQSKGARYAEREGGPDGARGLEELAAGTHARIVPQGAASRYRFSARFVECLLRVGASAESVYDQLSAISRHADGQHCPGIEAEVVAFDSVRKHHAILRHMRLQPQTFFAFDFAEYQPGTAGTAGKRFANREVEFLRLPFKTARERMTRLAGYADRARDNRFEPAR